MSEYLIVNGQRIPESEFYKALGIVEAKRFAYDPQLQLFPNAKTEEARAQLRRKFDSGESIDVVVLKK